MTFTVPFEIGDSDGARWERVELLVGTQASYTVVPAEVLERLGIEPEFRQRVTMADGQARVLAMADAMGRYEGEAAHTLVVFGDADTQPVLGAYTLTGMGLVADAEAGRLVRRQ